MKHHIQCFCPLVCPPQLYFNYTRLCKSEVDPACLANNVAEVCTAQAIDAMLRQEAPHQGSSAAAIIAPVVVGERVMK